MSSPSAHHRSPDEINDPADAPELDLLICGRCAEPAASYLAAPHQQVGAQTVRLPRSPLR